MASPGCNEDLVAGQPKPRIAVVSPFLDKRHGTERMVIEWVSHLGEEFEIHIYSQRVEDLNCAKYVWHRIPRLPGPHLAGFLWWFAANHMARACDRWLKGLRHDLTFSPGPNCLDADAISVHIVFAGFVDRVKSEIEFRRNPVRFWPRLLHRQIYYRLAILLERRVYTNPRTRLILTSCHSERDLKRFYGGDGGYSVVSAGVDDKVFNASRRDLLRRRVRLELGLQDNWFVALLIGNDLRNKGIRVALDALSRLFDLSVYLIAVTQEDPLPFRAMMTDQELRCRVDFLPPRGDVESYYAAADAYIGPSLEDTFALPALEAMACGLPIIISARAGASRLVTDGVDGMILNDPTDARALATMIRRLVEDVDFRARLGCHAARTAQQYTWERSSKQLAAIFRDILARKQRAVGEP